MNLRKLSLYIPIDPWIDCPTEKLLKPDMQLFAASDALLFGVLLFGVENWFGIENGSFIGNWISINLFTFGPSVGWKLVRNYASY